MQRPSRASFLACTLIAVLSRADSVAKPQLPIVGRRLQSGMTIVIAPDTNASTVHVSLRFAGGAGDELPDQAGYTSLVERLFADGSVHVKSGEHARLIETAGGWTASQTTVDELVLSTEVRPEALELVLWLEAERMAGLADALSGEHVAKERAAIAVAYRAAYVDEPYALVPRALRGALWPATNANSRELLGDPDVLARASVDSVRAFVRERIQPARATLVIAGRVTAQQAGDLAQRYFQWIPRRAVEPAASPTVGPLAAPVHLDVRDPLAQIAIGYRVKVATDPRTAADQRVSLEVLARVIAESPGSPMADLIGSKRATDVRAEVVWHARGAELVVHVTAADELDREGVEVLADQVRQAISAPAERPPNDELVARLASAWLTEHVLALENISGRAATYPEWASYSSIDEYVRALQSRAHALRSADIATLARMLVSPSSAVTVVGLPERR